jgi:hypothetical protein
VSIYGQDGDDNPAHNVVKDQVTLGDFRRVTADLPDETPLALNDDGRSDLDIPILAVTRYRTRIARLRPGRKRMAVILEVN